MSSGRNRNTFGWAPARLAVLWCHRWGHGSPFLSRALTGAVCAEGDMGYNVCRQSPLPFRLKCCGLWQNLLLMSFLSRSEKYVFTSLCLVRWMPCKMPPFPKHAPSATWKSHKDPNVLKKHGCLLSRSSLLLWWWKTWVPAEKTHVYIAIPLAQTSNLIPCPINQGPIDYADFTLVWGALGPLLWVPPRDQHRCSRKDLFS